ncbi:hypothetical protein UFOVP735_6 [uncultured Caudovirales phage]|uniref:Uncharacterized protein n=1 Tax=uncultured Caudovirales phage TaxID=2100421 RepID=A0A6J7X039_9CAUD|nr:hypothetical protein UFOVP735_6 [uncultured Caudovirales phage]
MSRRIASRTFPSAPSEWDAASRETWNQLVKVLEQSDLFDPGRRSRPLFIVQGTVSAPTTIDMNTPPTTAELTNIVGKLLLALQSSNFVDVR